MKMAMRRFVALAVLVAAVSVIVSCGNDDPTGPGTSGGTVHVRGTAGYSMDAITITAGQSVTWTWDAGGHSVTSSDFVGGIPGCTPNGLFDSGVLAAGATFTHSFPTAGTFPYYCKSGTDCSSSFESAVVVVQ